MSREVRGLSWMAMIFFLAGARRVRMTATNLLHDSSLALGECDVATRLVADELDLDLATLAAALVVVIIVIFGCAGTGTLDAAILSDAGVAIADRMRLVELGRRGLVVLISDVGHFFLFRYHEIRKRQNGGDAVLSVVPMA